MSGDDEVREVAVNACGTVAVATREPAVAGYASWRVRTFDRAGTPLCILTESIGAFPSTLGALTAAWDPTGGLIVAGGLDPLLPMSATSGTVRRYQLQDCAAIVSASLTSA